MERNDRHETGASKGPPARLPPYRTFLASDQEIQDLLRRHRTFLIAAARGQTARALAEALRARGYRAVEAESVEQVRERAGVVLVTAPSSDPEAWARRASEIGAEAVWFQPGVADPATAFRASRLGLTVVLGRDVVREHDMFFPEHELR